jgi:tetratricopeptide (TPR) repeat protein
MELKQLIRLGEKSLVMGDLSKAEYYFTEVIHHDSEHAKAYSRRSYASGLLEKFDEMREDATKAIELNPEDSLTLSDAYVNRSYAFIHLDRFDEAIQDATKAIELDPKDFTAYNNRACALNRLKKYDEAIQDATKAIELNPRFFQAYNHRTKAYFKLKKYDDAYIDSGTSLAIESMKCNNLNAYRGRGYVCLKLEKFNEAIRNLTTFLISTECADEYETLERAHTRARSCVEKNVITGRFLNYALNDITRIIQLDIHDLSEIPKCHVLRGDIYFTKGDKKSAKGDYEKALSLFETKEKRSKSDDKYMAKVKQKLKNLALLN